MQMGGRNDVPQADARTAVALRESSNMDLLKLPFNEFIDLTLEDIDGEELVCLVP